MSNGFDWQRLARHKRLGTMAACGLFVIVAGLSLPKLFLNQPEYARAASSSPLAGVQPPQIDDGPSIPAMLARLLFGLLVVSGLIIAVARHLKHRQRPAADTTKNLIEVLGFLPVGRGLVYHVKIGNHHLLAGTDAFGFKKLMELPAGVVTPPADEPDELPIIISERVKAALPV